MKKIIFAILLSACVPTVAIFYFNSRSAPEQVFRANLTEAQKMLVTLRRAEMAYEQSHPDYLDVSAKINKSEIFYSEGWRAMKLPDVAPQTGFDYECLPGEAFCRALVSGNTGSAANGIRIDIKTGVFACLGAYRPVTTEGLDGTPVVVACQAF